MSVIITRMPSGNVTNVTYSDDPVAEVRAEVRQLRPVAWLPRLC